MLEKLWNVRILVLSAHWVDEQKESVGFETSFAMVMQILKSKKSAQDIVYDSNLRIISHNFNAVWDIARSNVLFACDEDLDI